MNDAIERRRNFKLPAAIKDDFTRRDFIIGGGAALLLGVAGCGTSSGSGEETTSGQTRAVEHKYGSTELSGTPKRVVTVGFSDQDAVLALGVAPVAVTDWYGDYKYATWPWAQDALGDAEPEVLNRGAFTGETVINFEKVASLSPDLILGLYSGITRDQYEKLSQIAPTVPQSGDYPDYGIPWQEATRMTGRALGREKRADKIVSALEEKFAKVREEHPEFDGLSTVVAERFEAGSSFARSPSDPRSRLMTDIGFEIPEKIGDLSKDSDGASISDERMDLLDRDLLVWNAGFNQEMVEEVANSRIYKQLDVVREGRDVFIKDDVLSGAWSWSTILSLPYALDGLVPRFAAAVNGDPETTG